jgi:hypothetical protein
MSAKLHPAGVFSGLTNNGSNKSNTFSNNKTAKDLD